MDKRQLEIFLNSVFFVLGFSLVFSILGVLLQGALSRAAMSIQVWLGRIGGAVIILFGLYLLGVIRVGFLEREHKLQVNRKFRYSYLTSFIFGTAFAAGWTPCVGAVLGAILTLAITNPANAFYYLFAYSLGLGIPFLLLGLFTAKASKLIKKIGPKLKYVNFAFGLILVIIGIFVFTNQLGQIASVPFLGKLLLAASIEGTSLDGLGIGVSFIAGLASFLSPCVLPVMPGFLSYLAITATTQGENKNKRKK